MRQERPRRNRPLTNYRSVANLGSRSRPFPPYRRCSVRTAIGLPSLVQDVQGNGRWGNGGVRFSAEGKPGARVGIS